MIALLGVIAVVVALTALGAMTAGRRQGEGGDAGPIVVESGDAGGHGCHDAGLGGCDVAGHH